jgi:hypothetical protein
MNRALGESGYTVLGLGNTMAPTRALIKSFSSQHPQHASTGINSSENKKKIKKTKIYDALMDGQTADFSSNRGLFCIGVSHFFSIDLYQ